MDEAGDSEAIELRATATGAAEKDAVEDVDIDDDGNDVEEDVLGIEGHEEGREGEGGEGKAEGETEPATEGDDESDDEVEDDVDKDEKEAEDDDDLESESEIWCISVADVDVDDKDGNSIIHLLMTCCALECRWGQAINPGHTLLFIHFPISVSLNKITVIGNMVNCER